MLPSQRKMSKYLIYRHQGYEKEHALLREIWLNFFQHQEVTPTIPDRNCLFRSLSINLYNHEDVHLAIRKVIVELEGLNKDRFAISQFLMLPILKITFPAWVNHLCGEQVELLAASPFFFHVSINYCQASQNTYT